MTHEHEPGRGWSAASAAGGHADGRSRSPGKQTLSEASKPSGVTTSSPIQRAAHRIEPIGAPRPTLAALFGHPVQRSLVAAPGPVTEEAVHAAATRGTATSASTLPYAGAIQRAFGRHDVSSIQAHVGAGAGAAAAGLGAEAYATGNHVVFGRAPDLHTAAHEAAHVVQQRGGVQLKGGVGQDNDAYERHADAVADRVVAGQSAERLLDDHAPGGGAPTPVATAIQARWLPGTRTLGGSTHRYWEQSSGDTEQRPNGWYDLVTGTPAAKRDAEHEPAPSGGDNVEDASSLGSSITTSPSLGATSSSPAPTSNAALGEGEYVLVRTHRGAPRVKGTILRVTSDGYVIRFADKLQRDLCPTDAWDNLFTDVERDPAQGGGTKAKRQRTTGDRASAARPSYLARHASDTDPHHEDAVVYDDFLQGVRGDGGDGDDGDDGDDSLFDDPSSSESTSSDDSDDVEDETANFETLLLSHRTLLSSAAALFSGHPAALMTLLKNGGAASIQRVLDLHPQAERTGNRLPAREPGVTKRKRGKKRKSEVGDRDIHFKDTFAALFVGARGGPLSMVGHGPAPRASGDLSSNAPGAGDPTPQTTEPAMASALSASKASSSTPAPVVSNLLPAAELPQYHVTELMDEFFYRNSTTPKPHEHVAVGKREHVKDGAITTVRFPPDGKHYHGEAKVLNSAAWFRELDGALAAIAAAFPDGAATSAAAAERALAMAGLRYKVLLAINRSSCRGCANHLIDATAVFWAKLASDPRFGAELAAVIKRLGVFDFEVSVAAQYTDTTARSLSDIGESGWHQSVHPTFDFDDNRPRPLTDNDNQMGLLNTLDDQSVARQRANPARVDYHQKLSASLAASKLGRQRRSVTLGAQMLAAHDELPIPPAPASQEEALAALHARRDAVLAIAHETLWNANRDSSGQPDQQVARFAGTLEGIVAKHAAGQAASTAADAWQAAALADLRVALAALVQLVDYLSPPRTSPHASASTPSSKRDERSLPSWSASRPSSRPRKDQESEEDDLGTWDKLPHKPVGSPERPPERPQGAPRQPDRAPVIADPVPDDGLPAVRTDFGKFSVIPGGRDAFEIRVNGLNTEQLADVQPILQAGRAHPDSDGHTKDGPLFLVISFRKRAGAVALLAALKRHFDV